MPGFFGPSQFVLRFLTVVIAMALTNSVKAQTEKEVAKQIEFVRGGFVEFDSAGRVIHISLRPSRPSDFENIDFGVFKNINTLSLCGDQITAKLLNRLQAIPPGLEILIIIHARAPNTEEALIGLLQKQKSLKSVTFTATAITDKTLAEVANLGDLVGLDLDRTRITDKGLKSLRKSKLTSLDLRNTAITDIGLLELKNMSSLQSFFLEGTKITDVGLQNLSDLRQLKLLGVDKTDVTESGKKGLNALLPKLRYYHFNE
jgi:Leucine-rich repeat (LRR) protein